MADSQYIQDEQVETDSEADEKKRAEADSKRKEEICQTLRKRLVSAEAAEKPNRELALDDLKNIAGEQWPEEIRRKREEKHRPVLTSNKLPGQIRQVTNDQRQNRPSFKTSPVDDHGDVHTSKVFTGLIRHILSDSNADAAFDTAFEGACQAGFGFWRLYKEYVNPMSFDQKIRIGRVPNQFKVYIDPFHQEPDGSDAKWGVIFDDVNKDDFAAEYPDSKLLEEGVTSSWEIYASQYPDWVKEDTVRIAEYFYIVYEEATIVQLSDGRVFRQEELKNKLTPEDLANGVTFKNKRKTMLPKVMHCKTNGIEVFEETEWGGKWIPIVPVYGNEIHVEGKKIRESLIRHAKDSQRMYNFMLSASAEMIGLAPKAPYVGYAGQFEGFEDQWENANSEPYAYLEVNPVTVNGQPAPLPQRNVYEPPIQAITQFSMISADDIKNITGIHDAALGRQSNETSGIAIQRRANQAQTSNFHFIDNLTRSLKHTGRMLVDLIPKVYDTERAIRIIGEEDKEEILWIHKTFEKPDKNGKTIYDWAGDYDVTIEIGPAYATKRQEAAAQMLELSKHFPRLLEIAGDLLVKNLDLPGAQDLADRIKKIIPPGIIDDPNSKDQQLPPEVMAKLQGLQQLVDKLTQVTNEQAEAINTKKYETDSKERIALAQIESRERIEILKADAADAIELFRAELTDIQSRQDFLWNQSHGQQQGPAPAQEEPLPEDLTGMNPDQGIPEDQQQPPGVMPANPME